MNAVLSLIRPRQWAKNLLVFGALFFSGEITRPHSVAHVAVVFLVFCLLSSATYIFNDWRDIEADRVHAVKRFRPLPSGRLPVPAALAFMVLLLVAACGAISLGELPREFWIIIGIYLAINVGYSLGLKQITVVELFLVSAGFVLRLLAGGVALSIPLSPWIVISTATIALLMATGKRRGDLARQNDVQQARRSLAGYTVPYLDGVLVALTGAILVIYLLFCVSDYAVNRYGENIMVTAIPVAMGLLRYLQLVVVYNEGDSPSDLLLRDKGLLAIVLIFIVTFGVFIYTR